MEHGVTLAVVTVVTALLVATVATQGPPKLEASGESDVSTLAHLDKAVTSLAFPGSPVVPEPRDPPPGGASGSESGSVSAHPPRGAQRGPLSDVPSQSSESEQGGRSQPESEEEPETEGL